MGSKPKGTERRGRKAPADSVFDKALARVGQESLGRAPWPCGNIALAIDPAYAPALLTVSSIEYQLGRVGEALNCRCGFSSCRQAQKIWLRSSKKRVILSSTRRISPMRTTFMRRSVSACLRCLYSIPAWFCLGKLGQRTEAIAAHRRAVELEPQSHLRLNDLGFSLTLALQWMACLN
jgi:hypothetical protein